MYGDPPARMHNPATKPLGSNTPTVEKVKPIEECPVDFQRTLPKAGIKRNQTGAQAAATSGDKSARAATSETDAEKRVEDLRAAVEEYKQALNADPYSSHATLMLAVAYDRVYRKGCALALLGRLYALSNHPDFQAEATDDINRIRDNRDWFKDYQVEAYKAVHL
jgi:lipopolysaccharide biosynthesis regulator YciM